MEDKKLDKALIELCNTFNKFGVRYVVVGGFAVIMHGLARMTEDIDFFIHDSAENVEKVKAALRYTYNDTSVDEIKPDDVKEYAVIRYGTPEGFYIDFIGKIGDMFSFDEVERDAEVYEIDNVKIPVCGLETLIKMEATMRDIDKRDLIFLKKKAEERKKSL
jgi:predicted nucleotidyltransferase